MKLHGLMWWIDRWRKSTAYTDMTLEEQGAYRNLLDEATLRGGALPDNPRVLARACGDVTRWAKVKAVVLQRFTLAPDGWRNDTLDAVLKETARRMEQRRTWRETKARQRLRQRDGQGRGQPGGQVLRHRLSSGSGSGSTKTPLPPFTKGGRLTRAELQAAKVRRDRVFGGCPHTPRCATYAVCVANLAQDARRRA